MTIIKALMPSTIFTIAISAIMIGGISLLLLLVRQLLNMIDNQEL